MLIKSGQARVRGKYFGYRSTKEEEEDEEERGLDEDEEDEDEAIAYHPTK